ncbi:MAG: prolipoprotein diacylglyceryl transferase [Chloroflexi bacterium]|nr:prolipoprotein diacylglyceryl transferase [Chloroflexota bacterium]
MHRVMFDIFGFQIYSYAVMLVVGFIFGLLLLKWRTDKAGLPADTAVDLSLYLIIGGIIGARLVYVFLNPVYYLHHLLEIIMLRQGGLSWHGGMAGGILAAWIYSRRTRIPFLKLLDLAIPSSFLGLAIGRIGCFLNGCCYGKISSLPWACVFKSAELTEPRHPAQIYELIMDLLIVALLLLWEKKQKFQGELIVMGIILYSIARFIVEIFRDSYNVFSGISQAQAACIIMLIIFIPILIIGRNKAAKTNKP